MKICIETYGCVASYDDAKIIESLLEKEHEIVTNPNIAEIIIMQTCVVKNSTDEKIKTRLKGFKDKKIIISGCMGESQFGKCKELFPNASIVNTFNISKISKVVKDLDKGNVNYFVGKSNEDKLKLFKKVEEVSSLQIGQGCISLCSFCETRLAKGNLKSYKVGELVKEFRRLVKGRCKRINITSTDNSCYGFDIGCDLPSLLKEILKVKGDYQIRVGMMNPQHLKKFLDELIAVYKNGNVFKFLHIPVQSGNDRILKEMGRGYSIKDFKEIVKKFRWEIPEIHISTDLIVGFPGETEEEFLESVKLVEEMKFEVLNISKFSCRPGTKAAKMEQLDNRVIKDRSRKLSEVYKKLDKKKKIL